MNLDLLNTKINLMRASNKPLPVKTAENLDNTECYSLESSLGIASRFRWIPSGCYDELKALPWDEAAKKAALLALRFYFSRLYSSSRAGKTESYPEYVAIHNKHWINLCGRKNYKKVQSHFFEPLKVGDRAIYTKGASAIQWRLKNKEQIQALLSKKLPDFKGSKALESNLLKFSGSWELPPSLKRNPIASLHYDNHLRWIEPIRKKLDEMENYQPIVDFLVSQGVSEKKAKVETNRFIQASFWEYLSLQKNDRKFVDSGFNAFSRVHTPSNVLKKNIEAFLIGETIYRFDIVSCHIAVLAVMSKDEALLNDIREGNDIYSKLCPTNREWAKQALLTVLNDQETEIVKNGTLRKKILPLQTSFEKLYPVAGKYLENIKKKNISFSVIGCEIEQRFMRRATEILKEENPELLFQVKFEHDGIASLSLDVIKAFQNAFESALGEEWASSYRGVLKSKLSQSRLDCEGIFREERIENIQIEADEDSEEEKELTIDNMFDDLFSDDEGLLSTYRTKAAHHERELAMIKREIDTYPKNEIPKALISRLRAGAYDLEFWNKQIQALEAETKNKESEENKWNLI